MSLSCCCQWDSPTCTSGVNQQIWPPISAAIDVTDCVTTCTDRSLPAETCRLSLCRFSSSENKTNSLHERSPTALSYRARTVCVDFLTSPAQPGGVCDSENTTTNRCSKDNRTPSNICSEMRSNHAMNNSENDAGLSEATDNMLEHLNDLSNLRTRRLVSNANSIQDHVEPKFHLTLTEHKRYNSSEKQRQNDCRYCGNDDDELEIFESLELASDDEDDAGDADNWNGGEPTSGRWSSWEGLHLREETRGRTAEVCRQPSSKEHGQDESLPMKNSYENENRHEFNNRKKSGVPIMQTSDHDSPTAVNITELEHKLAVVTEQVESYRQANEYQANMIVRLRDDLKEKDQEITGLKMTIQQNSNAELIELLQTQVDMLSEDFEREKEARERAENQVKSLRQQVDTLLSELRAARTARR